MTKRPLASIGLLALTSMACNASTMIGDVPPPDGSAPNLAAVGTMGHTCAPPQFAGDHPFTFPDGLEGVWTGYVQGGVLGLSSDAVELTLDHAADGASQIHVVYGTAAPPPPATVATDSYPPGNQQGVNTSLPVEGFSYLAHNVGWSAFGAQWRLQFMLDSAEPWAGWCHLQSSYLWQTNPTIYGCTPHANIYGPTDQNAPMPTECTGFDSSMHPLFTAPCAQLNMCAGGSICACDECGCDMPGITYTDVPTGPGSFDLLFDATSASGSSPNSTSGGSLVLMRAAN